MYTKNHIQTKINYFMVKKLQNYHYLNIFYQKTSIRVHTEYPSLCLHTLQAIVHAE